MIIWSRWGIVVLAFFGLGVALGFLTMAVLGVEDREGATAGVFVGLGYMASGGLLHLFSRYVVGNKIDKPTPAVVWEPVAAGGGGVGHQYQPIPVLHPSTGEQIWVRPQSTFFLLPIRIWGFLLPLLGLVVFTICLVTVLVSPPGSPR